MRSVLIYLSAALLLASVIAPAVAGEKCTGKKRPKVDPDEIIYDLTIPWPFRQGRGDADGDGVKDHADRCPDTPRGAVVDEHGCPIDSDGDGIYDGIDKCPDTPKKAKVDKYGCPIDSDGDGVYDGIDKCPDTPKGAEVDKRGCPLDSDGDGVYDGIDKCPDTPKGAEVDKRGCPLDSDGDGVYDGIDKCPDTSSRLKVDDDGCPIETSEIETRFLNTGMIRTSKILFEFNKADLLPESFAILNEIGSVLVEWPELEIEIGGHTDSQGSETYNQKLSEKRAQAVLDYLAGKFPEINAANLSIKGYGEGTPIVSNDSEQGRTQNRRVEFVVLNKEDLKRESKKKKLLEK
jgi:OOP family OmpA-OmpF porin